MRLIQKPFDWADVNAVKRLARRMVANHASTADDLHVRVTRCKSGKHSISKIEMGAKPTRNTVADIWWIGERDYTGEAMQQAA